MVKHADYGAIAADPSLLGDLLVQGMGSKSCLYTMYQGPDGGILSGLDAIKLATSMVRNLTALEQHGKQ